MDCKKELVRVPVLWGFLASEYIVIKENCIKIPIFWKHSGDSMKCTNELEKTPIFWRFCID
jgi:hypothetical protein